MRAAGLATVLVSALAVLAGGAQAQVADLVDRSALRVCADPGNLPLSARDGSGFENAIAELMGRALDRPVRYTWFPQVMGFVRKTLAAGECDLVIGYAQGDEMVLNTNHYYTSTHVLVTRADDALATVERLDDPALQGHRLGVVVGSPPATHLARAGLMKLAHPYNLMVDRRVEDPAGQMLDDLQAGRIDGALLWGPIGGPLAKARGLSVMPLLHETAAPKLWYRITMGVRQGELDWKHELNSQIRRHQDEIDRILVDAGVPILDDYGTALKQVAN
ncbi:substrate-binding domain-containing protein [Frigidibacter sp. MR17.24]|uniref:substrate-binding domain-containing protein n=1 Tax=Frigidibacter sp. MR17.24 TaxID=3127345 RepID=UPI00301317BE